MSDKIIYKMSGAFHTGDTMKTLTAPGKSPVEMTQNPDDIMPGQPATIKHQDDGWIDVTVRTLDEHSVKAALAFINKVEPDDIEIVQLSLSAYAH